MAVITVLDGVRVELIGPARRPPSCRRRLRLGSSAADRRRTPATTSSRGISAAATSPAISAIPTQRLLRWSTHGHPWGAASSGRLRRCGAAGMFIVEDPADWKRVIGMATSPGLADDAGGCEAMPDRNSGGGFIVAVSSISGTVA